MLKILFLCTGNTCRSPMAEHLLKNMADEYKYTDIVIDSAGISTIPGRGANEKAVEVLFEEGIELSSHETKQINKQLFTEADLILTMTNYHKQYLIEKGYKIKDKVFTLKELAEVDGNPDITDPYGFSLSVYRKTRKEIKNALKKLMLKLEEGNLDIVQNNILGSDFTKMDVAIGSDHAGYKLKEEIKGLLEEKGISCKDMGTESGESVDYPEFAAKVAESVAAGDYDRGILICGTGIGMSIAANKVKGIRAALCNDVFSAKATRRHNNSNVLTIGARVIGLDLALEIVNAWLSTQFTEEERHQRRINKISDLEGEN